MIFFSFLISTWVSAWAGYDVTVSSSVSWPQAIATIAINDAETTHVSPGVAGLQASIIYDQHQLTPASYSLGAMAINARFEKDDTQPGRINILIIPAGNDNRQKLGNGELLKIYFTRTSSASLYPTHVDLMSVVLGDAGAKKITVYEQGESVITWGDDSNGSGSADDYDFDGIPDTHDSDDDNDGLPDSYENQFSFLNPKDASDANADYDGDGLINRLEYVYNTKPDVTDSDGDGINDKAEVDANTNPRDDIAVLITIINSLLLN